MPASIHIESNVAIETRDGVKLRADIFRPDDNEKHPAILMRSYNRALHTNKLLMLDLVNAGYAFISSDIRGRGTSEGVWKPENGIAVEGIDGYDTVEWIAGQKWCDGNVGTAGLSHMTFFQYMNAIQQSSHLKAIAPWSGDFNEMFIPPYTGGAISLATLLLWMPNESADVVNRMEKGGKDVTEMRRILEWARNNPAEVAYYLPLREVPLSKIERVGELLNWRLRPIPQSVLDKNRHYEKVKAPCFSLSGWYDGVCWLEVENFNNLRQKAGSDIARKGQHITLGPWPHHFVFQPTLGDINFGIQADTQGSMIYQHLINYYDKYLRGKDITIPAVRYFLMGRNQWLTADAWPLPQTQWQRFYLHSKGRANSIGGNGMLSRDEPLSEPPDIFIYNPLFPVPTLGGPLIGGLTEPGIITGPVEQSFIEKRSDVLCYTSDEFKEDVEITGPLKLHLFAATSAVDTDFAAKMIHVYPDGRAYNLGDGLIRVSGRNFKDDKELVTPGEVYEYEIVMGHTSQLIRRGHRIRIDITSSNFPQFDRNMNTGNPIGVDAAGITAMQTIYHQSDHASCIDLPVIPLR